jgi:hypothetical protein
MQRQVQAMHDCIVQCCKDSHRDRVWARLLFDSDAMQVYLRAAFQHFRTTIDEPFNFKKVSFRVNPIPYNFGDRILELAEAVYTTFHTGQERPKVSDFFTDLAEVIASCVLLDVHRYRKGIQIEIT